MTFYADLDITEVTKISLNQAHVRNSPPSGSCKIHYPPPFLHINKSSPIFSLTLTGIYIKDHLFFLSLKSSNKTGLPLYPTILHCTEQDRHQLKQTATQSVPLTPIYLSSPTILSPDSTVSLILALKPFPLSKTKNLLLEWGEPSGQRLTLSIRESLFLKARKLSSHE